MNGQLRGSRVKKLKGWTFLTVSLFATLTISPNDKVLSGMSLNAAELLDLSFLEKLRAERKSKGG
jgi:hypothetical protein